MEFSNILKRPYGLILVCGPTGSGKTTTLHSALKELNTPDVKIWTAEDPVEIVQKDICQVQINSKIGWTFAAALRSFLRSDPDVVMIGEMRDHETAKIAVEASMTGHLVLSTLHTNSASETAARLLDLGIDQYNLADALLGVLAQRLARRLCSCASSRVLSQSEALDLAGECIVSETGVQPSLHAREELVEQWRKEFGNSSGELVVKDPVGCPDCQDSGHKGRLGLYEMMPVSKNISALIRNRASAAEVRDAALSEGMRVLKRDGVGKVLRGLTDMRQIRSACA